MTKTKLQIARETITQISQTELQDLVKRMERELGRELCSFFVEYSRHVLQTRPESYISLMALGYMIRVSEEREEHLEMIGTTNRA